MRARRTLLPALLALASCAPRKPPPDLSLDPAELLAQVRAAAARVSSVKGEARIRMVAPGMKGTVPAFVAAGRPDLLHVESLDFFGNPIAVLVTAGGRLSLYDAREKVLYRGEATPENLARLVPVPVDPAELVEVLCGSVPLLAGAPVRAEPGRGFVELVLSDGARTQTVRVGAGAAVLRSEVSGPGEGPPGEHEVAFGSFVPLGEGRFPTEASLASPGHRVRVELAWTDPEPNAPLDPALFRLDPPRGARVEELPRSAPLLPAPLAPAKGP